MSKAHSGFKAAAASILKRERDRTRVAAILASSSRNASPAAKKANPPPAKGEK